jgi:hypothetical protein
VIGRRYTDAQRDAIAAAYHSDPDLTAPQVSKMAAAGELVDRRGRSLPPFQIPATTARTVARKMQAHLEPEALAATNRRLEAYLLNQAWEDARAIKKQPKGKRNMRQLAGIATVVARVDAVLANAPKPAPRAEPQPPGESPGGSLLVAMREAENASLNGGVGAESTSFGR